MMQDEMIIFTRTYDFISWLIPLTNHFPRSQRFVITKRLTDAALDFYELIIVANTWQNANRVVQLNKADAHLVKVRHYLRLCRQWEWITPGQYQHAATFLAEIGKLLGGWLKQSAKS